MEVNIKRNRTRFKIKMNSKLPRVSVNKSNRYFFVWDPKKIKIKDAPKVVAKAPMHPDFKSRGRRSIKTNGEFYICDELDPNKYYRFMHLFNFKDKKYASRDYDPKLKLNMIHWLPVSDVVKVEVLLEDGKIVKGLGELIDEDESVRVVDEVFLENEKAVNDLKRGKENAVMFLMGQVMKKTKGKVKPGEVILIIREKANG